MPIVSVKDLNFILQNGDSALFDISFEINKGEIFTIVGPNGGGKTTLIKLIIKLLKPFSGSVYVGSNKIGYMPQAASVNNNFPIKVLRFLDLVPNKFFRISEDLMCQKLKNNPQNDAKSIKDDCNFDFCPNSCYLSNSDNRNDTIDNLSNFSNGHSGSLNSSNYIDNVFNFVNIQHLKNKNINDLSIGELQKVLFARSILSLPDILILDEPTQGLDISSQLKFFDMLNKINILFGTTIVMVSHDLDHVLSRSTKVLCINKKIQCFGKPEDINCGIYNSMKHYIHNH